MRGGVPRGAVEANCDYVGAGYGQPTPGMIDLIRKGEIVKGERVVFLHTGGAVGLFGYTGVFEQAMG